MLETAHCGALDISHQSGVGGGTGLVVTEDHLAQFPDRDLLELAIDAFDSLSGRGRLKAHLSAVERLCRERGIACPTEEHVSITIYNYMPGRKRSARRLTLRLCKSKSATGD
jgi:hypothetical protein